MKLLLASMMMMGTVALAAPAMADDNASLSPEVTWRGGGYGGHGGHGGWNRGHGGWNRGGWGRHHGGWCYHHPWQCRGWNVTDAQ